jgi:hypothetical protein
MIIGVARVWVPVVVCRALPLLHHMLLTRLSNADNRNEKTAIN